MKFQHILFPVDFSQRIELLNPAVEWIAGHFGSQVTLIHVFEIPAAWSGAVHVPLRNVRCFDSFSERLERNLKDYSIHLPPEQVQHVMVDGDAAAVDPLMVKIQQSLQRMIDALAQESPLLTSVGDEPTARA